MTTDFLTGTVKGPGEMPHEYLFITKDNKRTRIGEFVYYTAVDGENERQIIGTIKGRKLVRNLPDAFLSDPNTPPSLVSSLIGLNGDACEIYEIQVETIGFFDVTVNDFNNPRIPPKPGDAIYLASSETLAGMLSAKKMTEVGSAIQENDNQTNNFNFHFETFLLSFFNPARAGRAAGRILCERPAKLKSCARLRALRASRRHQPDSHRADYLLPAG